MGIVCGGFFIYAAEDFFLRSLRMIMKQIMPLIMTGICSEAMLAAKLSLVSIALSVIKREEEFIKQLYERCAMEAGITEPVRFVMSVKKGDAAMQKMHINPIPRKGKRG